jgi:tRNA uridine 5-carboxymethylaminomethyl modification enzyme
VNDKRVSPESINDFLISRDTNRITQKIKAINIAMRPQIQLKELLNHIGKDEILSSIGEERKEEILESAEIKIKYEGYIQREKIVADKIKRLEMVKIPDDVQYDELMSISTEGRQKLQRIKPGNIGQASRISGVSPSDVNILLMYLGR